MSKFELESKRLLRNYRSIVATPSRTIRTVFVVAPSHANFAPASKYYSI
jgi:hypothetical protein